MKQPDAFWVIVAVTTLVISVNIFGKSEFCEPCEQAARAGVNYHEALARAKKRNKEALAVLFRVGLQLDGAASEVYCSDLKHLLDSYGDAEFAHCLGKEPVNVRERILGSLDFAYRAFDDERNDKWSEEFPSTYRSGSHKELKRFRASHKRHSNGAAAPN